MASPAIGFTPKHDQPFTLEQAMLLEITILVQEIKRLENSISHLRTTQAELSIFLEEDPTNDSDGEIKKAISENEGVIASQIERIALIRIALMNKVGEESMGHYGFGLDDDPGGGGFKGFGGTGGQVVRENGDEGVGDGSGEDLREGGGEEEQGGLHL